MKFLADTNVLSEWRRPGGNSSVVRAMASIADASLFISVITLGEIVKGMIRLPHGRRREHLGDWLDGVERHFGARALPVDAATSRRWGEITQRRAAAGRALATPDGLIAATAFVHDLALLTRNVKDFVDVDVRIVDPWTTPIA